MKWSGMMLSLLGCVLMTTLSGCRTTKFVPEDRYLLNKTKIEVTDTKDVSPAELKQYLRQTQNSEIFGFWKLQLHIYNTAPKDTTTKARKRLARNAHRMGEAPEIFDEDATAASMEQLKKAMQNKGYFLAEVDTVQFVKKQKLNLTYSITANQPYRLRDVGYVFTQPDLHDFATDSRTSFLQEGMLFDADRLSEERSRIASDMRDHGYFYFEKEMLRYTADSTVGHKQVDLEIGLQPYMDQLSDSSLSKIFSRYYIGHVYYEMGNDSNFLRRRTLRKNNLIHEGDLYCEDAVEKTYEKFNSLGVVKYMNISFRPSDNPNELDCYITLSRRKLNTVSAEIEGTYSAGDWGISAGLSYINKNIFHGAEELSLNGRGSYEWRQNGSRAIEGVASAGLAFPNKLKVGIEYNYQVRPEEFTRTIANAHLGFSIHHPGGRWHHSFNFVDISYVYLPWISDDFRAQFLQPTNIMKYSYENHFIVAFSYACSYSSFREKQPLRSYGNFRLQVESAGNVLDGIARLAKAPTDDNGTRKIFNIPYAQYVKADFDFAYHYIINEKHRLVVHGNLGCAVPYGNAKVIPFEKRYFAGGGNSVRGWTIRSLGPGAYKGTGDKIDYNTQSGDVKLDLNLEYRWNVWNFINLAAFTDAGNIWTYTEYDSQPEGDFKWNRFYQELAWSYGVGLRLDFNFFVFRVDFGVKLYDPSRISDGKQWRTAGNGLCWKDDMTFHFAIGYPF
ncbi:MAG: BamA/TamA family outer membrane protein [Paludibacteraceae bacterium]|nr:BamA/TamA family outer membrane protein [Paludibacteraceae bacterium]